LVFGAEAGGRTRTGAGRTAKVGIALLEPGQMALPEGMHKAKTQHKSLVVAHGRYGLGGFDTKVYEITPTTVKEWAWHGVNSPLPPATWSLREVRRRCQADVDQVATMYAADNAGVQLWPRLEPLQSLLTKRGVGRIGGDFRLLSQAMCAFGSARAAATWLIEPNPEFGGALPFMHATYQEGWFDVFDALVRIEYRHRLPPE
jgi:hypothetical protein